jgi:23S rRNA (cytosine1962-C5)-methyltransferase
MESMFKNRVVKNYSFLKKWANRENITAFRVYDKDIPQYPFAVDLYSGAIVLYQYERSKNQKDLSEEFEAADKLQLEEVILTIKDLFQIDESNIFLKVRKKQKGLSQYERETEKGITKIVNEGEMKFIVNLSDYLDCGLFLDHRKTRQIVKKQVSGNHVLNLFAYTGSVSIAAALGNAKSVTTVDMSNTYLNWAESNFKLNNISLEKHEFIRADIMEWLPKMSTKSKKYDFIFIDPPSFSNSKKMLDSFDVQKDYVTILKHCEKMLSKNGKILFSCNLRSFKFANELFTEKFVIEDITKKTLPQDFRNEKIHHAWILTKKD